MRISGLVTAFLLCSGCALIIISYHWIQVTDTSVKLRERRPIQKHLGQLQFVWRFWSSTPAKEVIIVSVARSGSSFLGDLVALEEHSSYFFEPLWFLGPSIDKIKPPDAVEALDAVFKCKIDYFQPFLEDEDPRRVISARSWYDKKAVPYANACRVGNPIIAKVIRLPVYSNLVSWIAENPERKVVYLVRDPRGIFNSRLREPPGEDFSLDMEVQCKRVVADYGQLSQLSSDQLLLVRYEDVARKPFAAIDTIYSFLGWPVTESVERGIMAHTASLGEVDPRIFNDYWSTFRDVDTFDPDHWKTELTPSQIRSIEVTPYCDYILEEFRYQIFKPPVAN